MYLHLTCYVTFWWVTVITTHLIMPLILLAFLCELQISQSCWIASKLGCSVLNENKRYIFHFHQEFHWTMYLLNEWTFWPAQYNVDEKKSFTSSFDHLANIYWCLFCARHYAKYWDTELNDAWPSRRLMDNTGLQANTHFSRYQLQ